jgi:hypothetical protein
VSILLVLLAAACAAPWLVLATRRWGALLAVPAVVTTMVLAIILTLLMTPALPVNLGIVVLVELALGAALGLRAVRRSGPVSRAGASAALSLWLPATLGAGVWLVVRLLSLVLPDASTLAWAMEGDTANNLFFARQIADDNGVVLGPDANPVPIVASSLAVPLALERLPTSGDLDLGIELGVFAWTWTAVIALCCIAMGAVAASLVDARRTVLHGSVAALGSLLPLTWFVSELPIDFGYLNAHFALSLLLASWLVFLCGDRAPVPAVAVLVGVAILMLLTWTPVVLVPVALGLVTAVRHRTVLLRARRWGLAVPVAACVLFLALAAALTLPTLLAQTDSLVAGGHGYPDTWMLSLVLVATTLLGAARLRGRHALPVFAGVVALVVASYLAAASTLYIARDLFTPWTAYYPAKLAWLICALLLPVGASIVAAVLTTSFRRIGALVAAAVVAGSVVLAAVMPVPRAPDYAAMQPLERILTGAVWHTGDRAADIIVALSRDDATALLWNSGSADETIINFWAMDGAGGHIGGDLDLRRFAFKEYRAHRSAGTQTAESWNALCTLLRDREHGVVVYTDDGGLENDLAEQCTGSSARFVVGATPGLD